jgi:peptidoglycan hydrolase FlgJ
MTSRIDMQLLNPTPRANGRVGEALYTDLNALKGLSNGDKSPESLRAVAQQFESIFVKMMLDSMRDANAVFAEDNYLQSSETDFYQDMMDNQLSVSLAKGKGIGLADVIFEQLNRYNSGKARVDTLDHTGLQDSRVPVVPSLTPKQPAEKSRPINTLPPTFDSPEHFVETLTPLAAKVGNAMGVDHRALIAQAALETGWGKYINQDAAGNSSFNLFNIKADHRWQGETVSVSTLEYRDGVAVREKAQFRAYNSFEESFSDYLRFISESPRYQQALQNGGNGHEYVKALQAAGYATDPAYAEKIGTILASNTLSKDRGA